MATKGWSFGALTAALKSAAFIDASANPAPGQIPYLDPNANLLLPNSAAAGGNGFIVNGPSSQYKTFVGNVKDTGGLVPNNWFSQMFQATIDTDKVEFGIVRATGNAAIGYGIAQNGVMVYQYMKATARHKMAGIVYMRELQIGVDDTSTTSNGSTQAYLKVDGTQISMGNKAHQWGFTANGGIAAGAVVGNESDAGLRCQPNGGGWESWQSVPVGLQVDLTGSSASTIWRATLWGNRHVASMQAAYSGNTCVSRWVSGGKVLVLADGIDDGSLSLESGGISAGGNIIAGGIVMAGNGSGILFQDGNINGPMWGNNYLSNWLNNKFNARDNEINNRVHDMRFVNQRRIEQEMLSNVVTGIGDFGASDGYGWASDLQFYKNSTGWVTVGWQ